MRKVKQILVGSFLVAVLLLSLVACQSKGTPESDAVSDTSSKTESVSSETGGDTASETVKMKLFIQYSADQEVSTTDYALEKMKEIMPQVEVEIEPVPEDNGQKLDTYAASGNLPDIFHADGPTLEPIIQSGTLLQLDSYVKEAGLDEAILPSYKDAMYFSDGHIYAMPWTSPSTQMTFGNKAVFEDAGVEIPGNYEEMLAAVPVLKEKGYIPYALFGENKGWCVHFYDQILTRETADGIRALDEKTAQPSDAAFINAANKCIELVNAGIFSDSVFNTGYDQAKAQFIEGKAAMFIDGSWGLPALEEALGENLVIMYSPFAEKGQEEATQWNMCGGYTKHGFAVPNYSENPEIAAQFAVELSRQVNFGFVVKTGSAAVYADAPETEYNAGPVYSQYLEDSTHFETLSAFEWNLSNPALVTALEDRTQQLLTGQYTAEEFAADIADAIAE